MVKVRSEMMRTEQTTNIKKTYKSWTRGNIYCMQQHSLVSFRKSFRLSE